MANALVRVVNLSFNNLFASRRDRSAGFQTGLTRSQDIAAVCVS